jgi:Cu/Ag efflux protein CusF
VGFRFDRQYWKRPRIFTTILSIGLNVLTACGPTQSVQPSTGKEADSKMTIEAKDTTAKRYSVTGRVVSIDKPAHSVSVDGAEIPGFMAAMTMPYQVKDASVLDKLSPGDQIKAEIVMGDDGAYLENIVLAQKASSPKPTN